MQNQVNQNQQPIISNIDPVAPWVGGKRILSKVIGAYIRKTEHTTYAEPFVGMGGVFFRKRCIAPIEVINDYNGEIINLFRVLTRHKEAFINSIKYMFASREEFERFNNINSAYLTDIEKAVRFFYLQRLGFGGVVNSKSFPIHKATPSKDCNKLYAKASRFNLERLIPKLDKVAERLYRVILENMDFEQFIKKYDSDFILYYLDPPYFNCENYYGKDMFKREDFIRLRDTLANIKGKFIMSINDTPEIRKLFEQFIIKEVNTNYSICGGKQKQVGELLIFNYEA
ncbi:DNA adenine methylase [Rickettsiales bacterium LUAb2]